MIWPKQCFYFGPVMDCYGHLHHQLTDNVILNFWMSLDQVSAVTIQHEENVLCVSGVPVKDSWLWQWFLLCHAEACGFALEKHHWIQLLCAVWSSTIWLWGVSVRTASWCLTFLQKCQKLQMAIESCRSLPTLSGAVIRKWRYCIPCQTGCDSGSHGVTQICDVTQKSRVDFQLTLWYQLWEYGASVISTPILDQDTQNSTLLIKWMVAFCREIFWLEFWNTKS